MRARGWWTTVTLVTVILGGGASRTGAQEPQPQFYVPFDGDRVAATIAGGERQPQVSGTPQFAAGRKGGALVVRNGSVVAFSTTGNVNWQAGTLAFWVCLAPPPGGGEVSDQVIFTANSPTTPGYLGLQILSPARPQNGNLLEFWLVRFAGVGDVRLRTGAIKERWPFGTWHHVALTWNRERWTLALDGDVVAEATAGRALTPEEAPGVLNLGDVGAPQPNASRVLMDDLRVYHYPLNTDEVQISAGRRAAPAAAATGPGGGSPLPTLLQRQITLGVTYLPSLGRLSTRVDLGKLQEQFKVDHVTVAVVRAADGARIREERLPAPDKGVATRNIPLPKLRDGEYRVTAMVVHGGQPVGQPVEASFAARAFPWEGNTLGRSEKVAPPFTPLAVSGDTVSMVLRQYRFGGMGLPAQVTAMGEPILSGPMALEAVVGGRVVPFRDQRFRVTRAAPHEVVVEGSGTLGRITASLRTTLEYDGFVKVALTLSAASPTDLDRLSLVIPVKSAYAPLMHAVGDGIRANYAGAIPAGAGKVWDSTLVRRELIQGTFAPYLWVGEEERGFCWMADWDRHWSLAPAPPRGRAKAALPMPGSGTEGRWVLSGDQAQDGKAALEILRDPGIVRLRVNFINQRTRIQGRRGEIVFGLQATPVKPLLEGWQRLGFRMLDRPFERIFVSAHTTTWGGRTPWADIYPMGWDFEMLKRLMAVKGSRKLDIGAALGSREIGDFVADWQKRHGLNEQEVIQSKRFLAINFALSSESAYFVPYTNARELDPGLPEAVQYAGEWYVVPHAFDRIVPVRSFQDMALASLKRMIQAGVDGVYIDNSFPQANLNVAADQAYVMEDGRIQPGCGLFAMREYLKRIRLLFHEMGNDRPLIIVHTTNGLTIPCFSFATAQYDWEMGVSPFRAPERLTADWVRAESMGRQAGLVPFAMSQIGTDSEAQRTAQQRAFWAMCLPHGIKGSAGDVTDYRERDRPDGVLGSFPIWADDCAFVPYWEIARKARREVSASPGQVVVSYYRRPGQVLLICGNLGGGAQDLTLTVDPRALGLGAAPAASDPCDGQPVRWDPAARQLKLSIPAYDYRMVLLKG